MCLEMKSAQLIRDIHKPEENWKRALGFPGRKWNVLQHRCPASFLPMGGTLEGEGF